MTLNDLERRNNPYFTFFTEIDSFAADYVTVAEERPIMSAKLLSLRSNLSLLAKTNAPCSAVSLP